MATDIVISCSGIKFNSSNCGRYNSSNFTQAYDYQSSNSDHFIVNDDGVEFEEEKTTPPKEKIYALFDKPHELGVPIDIVNRAEQISQKMDRAVHNRKGRRKMRQFVCLYTAYGEMSVDVYSPQGIADIVGLPHEEISPAMTAFSPLRSGYKPAKRSPTNVHPSARIAADFAKDLDFTDEEIEHIKLIIIDAVKADPKIKARKPGTIAIGGIAACVSLRNKNVSLEKLQDVSKISPSTIKQTRDQILTAYNS